MIKVAITDDHPLILKGISELVAKESDMQLLAQFNNGKDCLEAIQQMDIDVLLLDYNLPDMDGEQICQAVKNANPSVRILVLTSFDDTGIIKKTLNHFGNGFAWMFLASDNSLLEIYSLRFLTIIVGATFDTLPKMGESFTSK